VFKTSLSSIFSADQWNGGGRYLYEQNQHLINKIPLNAES